MATLGHCKKCGARWMKPDIAVPGFRPPGMCRCAERQPRPVNTGVVDVAAILATLKSAIDDLSERVGDIEERLGGLDGLPNRGRK